MDSYHYIHTHSVSIGGEVYVHMRSREGGMAAVDA